MQLKGNRDSHVGKIAVMADIHSNLPALKKALDILKEESVDRIVVCGDVVGYGRYPNECCEIIRALKCPVVAGNHDWAVAGLTEYKDSHSDRAIQGIEFTKKVITPQNLLWLQDLPIYYTENGMEFVHGSLVEPEKWYYLTLDGSSTDPIWQGIQQNLDVMKGQICFVGHLHVPAIFLEKGPKNIKEISPNKPFYELQGRRAIVNVGSIGQPRTSSKRASLVIYDMESQRISFKRFLISE
jgi:predicted phosphodiesterase